MPLVRQRAQRLGQQAQAIDLDRQFAAARAHQLALGTDDVANVPALESLVGLRQRRALQEQLDLPAHVLDGDEAGLAHDAPREDASRHADPARQRGNRLGGAGFDIGKFRLQVADKGIDAEIVRVGVAAFAQAVQFLATLGDQFVLVRRNGGRGNRGLCRIWRNAVGHFRGSLQGCREKVMCAGMLQASMRFAPASSPDFRLASMKSSISPSSTFCVSVRSMPVRRSLIRLWSST